MAKVYRQVQVEVADAVGRLAEITDKIKEAGINILALCAWVEGDRGHMRLVAEDAEKACAAVTPAVDKCEYGEVVCVKVPNEPGALNAVAHKLAEAGIAVSTVHAAAVDTPETTIILTTSDNAKAAEII